MRKWLIVSFCALAGTILISFAAPLEQVYTSAVRAEYETRLITAVYQVATGTDPSAAAAGEIRIVVTDMAGTAVLDTAGERLKSFASRPEMQAALRGESVHGSRRSSTLGDNIVYAAVPVREDGVMLGAVRASVPDSVISGKVAKVRRALALASMVAFGAAVLLALWISHWVVVPLRDLAKVARAHADGELTARSKTEFGPHEVREVAAQVNSTAAALDALLQIRTRFAADAAHQLRTPLSVLRLRLDVLALEHPGEDTAAALTAAERLEATANSLLAFARSGARAKNMCVYQVDDSIQRAVQSWEPAAQERGVELRAVPSGLPVYADTEMVESILDELVANALDATPHGGTVTIAALNSVSHCVLSVSDSGVGIPTDVQGRVFDAFWRRQITPDQLGSTGLGLALVKEFAEEMGGSVELSSSPAGTEFRVSLRTA